MADNTVTPFINKSIHFIIRELDISCFLIVRILFFLIVNKLTDFYSSSSFLSLFLLASFSFSKQIRTEIRHHYVFPLVVELREFCSICHCNQFSLHLLKIQLQYILDTI